MAIEANITPSLGFFKGEDKSVRFLVTDSVGNTQDMSGWALEWSMRRSLSSPTAVITKTTGAGEIAISNGSGISDRATVTVTDTDTEGLLPGRYYHALKRTDAGSEQVLSYGYVELQEAAAR